MPVTVYELYEIRSKMRPNPEEIDRRPLFSHQMDGWETIALDLSYVWLGKSPCRDHDESSVCIYIIWGFIALEHVQVPSFNGQITMSLLMQTWKSSAVAMPQAPEAVEPGCIQLAAL